ncbi:MAG: restriction endonuclease, partial [Streptomyces sp.]
MARRRRSTAARRRRALRIRWGAGGGALALILLVTFWTSVWPYLLGFLLVAMTAGIGWRLWRTDRL